MHCDSKYVQEVCIATVSVYGKCVSRQEGYRESVFRDSKCIGEVCIATVSVWGKCVSR